MTIELEIRVVKKTGPFGIFSKTEWKTFEFNTSRCDLAELVDVDGEHPSEDYLRVGWVLLKRNCRNETNCRRTIIVRPERS